MALLYTHFEILPKYITYVSLDLPVHAFVGRGYSSYPSVFTS